VRAAPPRRVASSPHGRRRASRRIALGMQPASHKYKKKNANVGGGIAVVSMGGAAPAKAKAGLMDGLADRMNGALQGAFFKLGYGIGKKPRMMICASLLLTALLAVGIGAPGITFENRNDKLWVPAGTQAQDDKKYVDRTYGIVTRFGEVIVRAAGGGDALTPEVFAGVATLLAGMQAGAYTREYRMRIPNANVNRSDYPEYPEHSVVIRLDSPECREHSVVIRPDTPECKPMCKPLDAGRFHRFQRRPHHVGRPVRPDRPRLRHLLRHGDVRRPRGLRHHRQDSRQAEHAARADLRRDRPTRFPRLHPR